MFRLSSQYRRCWPVTMKDPIAEAAFLPAKIGVLGAEF
jgi:hypothetical protein